MVGERGGGSGLGGNKNDGAVRTCMEGEKDYLKGRDREGRFSGGLQDGKRRENRERRMKRRREKKGLMKVD